MNPKYLLASLILSCAGAAHAQAPARPAASQPQAAQAQATARGATPTLDAIRKRGFVQCGVSTGIAGFSLPDAQGIWKGIDVDVCRAVAVSIFGDATKVRFTPLTAAQRFTALQAGEVDLLSRNTTITFQRDAQLGIEFPAVNWYDGTGFITTKKSGVKSIKDLNGASICIQPGTTTELDIADFFRKNNLKFTPVVIEGLDEAVRAYFSGRCDAFSQDQSNLAAVRLRAPNPQDHVVLSEVISKAPYGPGVMPSDIRFMKLVRWSVYAMVEAEELGLSSANIDQFASSNDPAIQRFIGKTGGFGAMLGVDTAWAYKIVKQVGNYRESYERNIKPIGIERGHNRLWKDGGLLYVPSLR